MRSSNKQSRLAFTCISALAGGALAAGIELWILGTAGRIEGGGIALGVLVFCLGAFGTAVLALRQAAYEARRTFAVLAPATHLAAVAGVLTLLVILGSFRWARSTNDGTHPAPPGDRRELFPVASIPVPRFPELGMAKALGTTPVRLHDIHLAPANPGSKVPGAHGKLRVYVPRGTHADRSLGCVLVAPAGTDLLEGNDLDGSDYHAETLPYTLAGYVVVAYSLDGGVYEHGGAGKTGRYLAFRSAHAGLVNARNALELVLARFPMVDPARIFAAGHSSAGTLSLLFAEQEPRLKGAIAYAPAPDVEAKVGEWLRFHARVVYPGLGDFLVRSSPRTHVEHFDRPLFLFHAKDDQTMRIHHSEAFADDMRRFGKRVEFRRTPKGGHYDSMIREGIPAAIAWMRSLPGESEGIAPPVPPIPLAGDGND